MDGYPRRFRALAAVTVFFFFSATAQAASDFAPLSIGNRWTYSGTDRGGGFWWNYTLSHSVWRTITVDAVADIAGGREWTLSYRDSLYKRTQSPEGGMKDTILAGRFRILDLAQAASLRVVQAGTDPLPSEMHSFFKAHDIDTEKDTVRPARHLYKLFEDSAAYVRGAGLAMLHRSYDVWNTSQYTPPYRWTRFDLVEFKGSPTSGSQGVPLEAEKRIGDFAPLRMGASWKWRALKRRVLSSTRAQAQDSLLRHVRVASAAIGQSGIRECRMALRDSLFARSHGDAARADTVEEAVFILPCDGGDAEWNFSAFGNESNQADLRRLFGSRTYPESMVEDLALPGGTVKAMILRDGMPGLFTDTIVYAQGIGFIRRAKLLYGIGGMTERMEYELVELDGAPFDAKPMAVPIRKRIGIKTRLIREGNADALGRRGNKGPKRIRFATPTSYR